MKKGKFIIISGPGGVGKDTICNELVKKGIGIYSISMTTRDKRINEIEGKDYFFVDDNTFKDSIKNNDILEYTLFNGYYYGTPKKFIFDKLDNGINVFAILDVKGALSIKERYPDVITIFIMPPSFMDLEKRLRKRKTDDEKTILKRLDIAKEEIKYKDKYDYVVINNTAIEAALNIINIINNC